VGAVTLCLFRARTPGEIETRRIERGKSTRERERVLRASKPGKSDRQRLIASRTAVGDVSVCPAARGEERIAWMTCSSSALKPACVTLGRAAAYTWGARVRTRTEASGLHALQHLRMHANNTNWTHTHTKQPKRECRASPTERAVATSTFRANSFARSRSTWHPPPPAPNPGNAASKCRPKFSSPSPPLSASDSADREAWPRAAGASASLQRGSAPGAVLDRCELSIPMTCWCVECHIEYSASCSQWRSWGSSSAPARLPLPQCRRRVTLTPSVAIYFAMLRHLARLLARSHPPTHPPTHACMHACTHARKHRLHGRGNACTLATEREKGGREGDGGEEWRDGERCAQTQVGVYARMICVYDTCAYDRCA